jgi:hypothetical protein
VALLQCEECSAAVSDQALKCPACGAPTPLARIAGSGTPWWQSMMWVGIALFVLATLGVLAADLFR